MSKSSYRRYSFEKAVLKNFSIFTGKHLCWSIFLIKLRPFRLCTFIEIALRLGCFPLNLLHIIQILFPKNTCGGLLLYFSQKLPSFHLLAFRCLKSVQIWSFFWSVFSLTILTLRPQMPHIYVVFWTVLVLTIFWPLPVAFTT